MERCRSDFLMGSNFLGILPNATVLEDVRHAYGVGSQTPF